MRQPGTTLPPGVSSASIKLKIKDKSRGKEEFVTPRKRVDVTRLMKKFKIIALMTGKLKAAQNAGKQKRTAKEEAIRLADLAKVA